VLRLAARRLIALSACLLLAAAAVAAPLEIGREATVADGTLRIDRLDVRPELDGREATAGRRFVLLAGAYRRAETAPPALLESASEAFRLRLADGDELAPDALTGELRDGWWGPLDIFPAEERPFLLLFLAPAGAAPQALTVRLEGATAEIPLVSTNAAIAAAEKASTPEDETSADGDAGTTSPVQATKGVAAPTATEPAAGEREAAETSAPAVAVPPDDRAPTIPAALTQPRNLLRLAGAIASIDGVDARGALSDGLTGPDAPVARVAIGRPLTILLTRSFATERIRVVPRAPRAGGYRLRLEITSDGLRWETLAEAGEGRSARPLSATLAGRPVRGLRITATAASPDVGALAVEEVELWSRERVPTLRYDLAWSGFGGRVVAVDPPGGAESTPLSRLVDGDPATWWQAPPGTTRTELVVGFLENRVFVVDAVGLGLTTFGVPRRVEIAVSTEGPDRGFVSVGSFAVPAEPWPVFTFQPRAARFVRLRIEGSSPTVPVGLTGVAVFEAEDEGLPSKLARFAAVPADAPPPARNLADWRNGGDLLAYPPLEGGEHWGLHDGNPSSERTVRAGETAFTLAFLGGRRARVDEVRVHLSGLDRPGRIRVETAEAPEGPFAPVTEGLLPPGRGWRSLRFDPVEARYLRVVIRTDPERAEPLAIGEIAVLERPLPGAPSIVEVPPEEQVPLGPNVALSLLGGRVVGVSAEERRPGWSARRLIDGFVADPWYAARGSLGFTTPERFTWPVEVDLELAGGRPVRIVGVGIDPRIKLYEASALDPDFRGRPANRPRRFQVEVSRDGRDWQRVFEGLARPRWVRQTFPFAEPVEARFVRFRFFEHYGGERLQMGELEVYEDPSLDSTSSVLADREIDIARPELGGAVVTVSSQNSGGEAYVGNMFDGDPRSIWSPGDGWRWPQKITLAFAGDEVAEIAALEIVPREPEYRPRSVKIRVTTEDNPTRRLGLVGRFEAPADGAVWRIAFPEPVSARFLELSFVEGFGARGLGIGDLRVIEVKRPGYRSVLARGLAPAVAHAARMDTAQTWTVDAQLEEREPNDDPAEAQIIEPGQGVAGRIEPLGERDHFLLRVATEEPRAFRFLVEGRPALRTRVELEDKGGGVTALDPDAGRGRIEGTVRLAPGGHMLRLFEPKTRIVLAVDTSGSMEASVADVRAAVERFLAGMTEQEEVAVVTFSSTVRVAQDFTSERETLIARAREVIGAAGGTALYDAMETAARLLADWRGNRAVVLLSDGADGGSRAGAADVYRTLATSGIRLYAIALGNGMQRYVDVLGTTPARMLGYWARVSDGAALVTPDSAALQGLYERIARDLRTGTRYRFRFAPETGTGRLLVRQTGERIAGVGVPDRILFILDASGSMRGRDRQGRVKMTTARRVLTELVRSLPEDVMVGLRVYGHRYPRKPKAKSCTDSQLVVPFQRVDREAFASFVREIRPRGQTPIGLSLARVAEDFGDVSGRKVVVLISDGEETCAPEPDDPLYPPRVVEELMRRGVDVQVQIVGFDIDESEVRASLRELAERTGGRFYTAEDAEGLKRALDQALRARFVVRDLLGEPVAEGVLDGGAIELPSGLYRVEIVATRPFVIEEVRIENGRETRLDVNREGEEIAVDRSIGEPSASPASRLPVVREKAASEPPAAEATAPSKPQATAAEPSPSASREQRIAALLEEAERLYGEKKLTTPEENSALARYRAVLALDPDNREARNGLARIVETYVDWATAAEDRGDPAKAERYYGRALLVFPDNADLLALRGLARLQLERYREAAADLEAALRDRPENAELRFRAGYAWFKLGRFDRALEHLERAWRRASGELRANAGYLSAAALVQLDRNEEALARLEDAITARGNCERKPLDATCSAMWHTMAQILRLLERDDVIMGRLVEMLDLEPQEPDLYTLIAETFRANGREEEARRIEALRRTRFGR